MKSNYNRTETFNKKQQETDPTVQLRPECSYDCGYSWSMKMNTEWNKHRKTLEDIQRMKQLLHDRRLKNVTCSVQPRKAKK